MCYSKIPITSGIRGFAGIPVQAKFTFLPGFLTGFYIKFSYKNLPKN